jgi:anti-sigma factor RsiW
VGGTLDEADKARVEGHVAECSHCASFGARYAALVQKARGALADPETEEAVLTRVRARLPRAGVT